MIFRLVALVAALAAVLSLTSCENVWLLRVEITGEGIGRVYTADGSFLCEQVERGVPRTCVENFRHGFALELLVDEEDAELIGWQGACSGEERRCQLELSEDRSVRVAFRARTFPVTIVPGPGREGYGRVTANAAGLDCFIHGQSTSGTCEIPVVKDDSIVLMSEALPGSVPEGVGWLGCNRVDAGRCVVHVDEARSIQALFRRTVRTVHVAGAGNGSGTVRSEPEGIDCMIDQGNASHRCEAEFPLGIEARLTAEPGSGSTFFEWRGVCEGSTSPTCTLRVTDDLTVTALFGRASRTLTVGSTGPGEGRILSNPSGIDCRLTAGAPEAGSTCAATFPDGVQVELAVEPAGGSTFEGWDGCDAVSGTVCTVRMDEERQVSVALGRTRHTLAVQPAGSGGGRISSEPSGVDCTWDGHSASGTCASIFDWGTRVRLTAHETSGSSFEEWSESDCSGLVCEVVLTADRVVTATFGDIPAVTLSVTGTGEGNGRVTSDPLGIDCRIVGGAPDSTSDCSEAFLEGQDVVLTAVASEGSSFDGWGAPCADTDACSFTMTESTVVAAAFSPIPRTVTVVGAGSGSGRVLSQPAGIDCRISEGNAVGPACASAFDHGTDLVLTAQGDAGYGFTGWAGPCSGGGSCAFEVTGDAVVTAGFSVGQWLVTVEGAGSGQGMITGSGISCSVVDGTASDDCHEAVDHGSTVTLAAAPASDTRFVGWSGACTGTGDCTLTVDENLTVTATFARQHLLTVAGGGGGSGQVTSAPTGIDCTISGGAESGTCEADFDQGVPVELTAAASAGSGFDHWDGCNSVSGSTCTVTLTAARQVTAVFESPELRLSTGALRAAATVNGADPHVRRVYVYNVGGGSIPNLTATMNPQVSWLDLSWFGDDRTADPVAILEVQPRTSGLSLGTLSTTVTVSGDGVASRSFTLAFEIIRGTTAETAAHVMRMHGLSEGSLGVQYDTAYLTIRNGGRARLENLSAVTKSKDPASMELDLAFVPGTDAPTQLRVIGGCSFEDPFFCEAQIGWQGTGIGEQLVDVEYSFNGDPELRVEPQGLTLTAFEGGGPVSGTATMINENPQATGSLVNRRLQTSDPTFNQDWLTASRVDSVVTVTADPSGLTAETSVSMHVAVEAEKIDSFGDSYLVTDSIRVALVVQRGLELSVGETDVFVSAGGAAQQVQVELSNGSGVPLEGLTATPSAAWLAADLGGATILQPGTGAATLTLTADPTGAGLGVGTHTATVTIQSTTPGVPSETVTVRLHVY